ncbi:MAG: hybrid sensor histidine kinase/response regulator [Anaerolineae bacterium]|nr:hybrid sensor histidine kinase/response regulator [Anaerolineae bacterium]
MAATGKTILYIEDDPASRTLVERTLRFAGYHVLLAERGLEGIDMARRLLPHLDMVLTDINLPDISGREITTMLRSDARFADIPIVALTAQAIEDQRELTAAAGITGYLTKPIDVEALPGQIEHYLSGGRDKFDTIRLNDARLRYTQEIVARLETRIRELEATNENLRRLDRMKDTFIQLTAHELRTPLTLVFGYSRLLEDHPQMRLLLAADENIQVLLTGLIEAVERMESLINEILTVSRVMTNQIDISLGPVSLLYVMERVIDSFTQPLEERHLELSCDDQGWPEKIRADAELLTLAFSHLVSNAIKYTPNDGTVTISAKTGDESVTIAICDSGIGISKEEQQHIFERFHTASDTMLHSTSKTAFGGGGLGLGLAVAKSIVQAHGGRIWVESEGLDPDRLPGSTFYVQLPLVAKPLQQNAQK